MRESVVESESAPSVFFELRNVSKQFPGVLALADVSVKFREREIHGIVGENGAGKTTLVNTIMGLHRPDQGRLLLFGKDVHFHRPADALAAGLGMVPQELNLVPHMSVIENIMLGAAPCSAGGVLVDWPAMQARSREALQRIGADVDLNAETVSLPVAQQQLVQIARALALGARLLILDEPTASLSLPEAERLLGLIVQLRTNGCAIIYISHRLKEVLSISDRVTVMRNGRLVTELARGDASETDLIRHMIGKVSKTEAPERRAAVQDRELALEVDGLTRKGEFYEISFCLHAGEILGVAGLVGAGRTELARCLFADTRRDKGQIRIAGREVWHANPADAIADGVAYVPEERKRFGIFPLLDVAENMTMATMRQFLRRGRIDRRLTSAATAEYIAKLAIRTAGQDQLVAELSGGNQQKVILGRWLLTGCSILILDEPTRGIDVNAKFEIHALLRRLAEGGMAILVISSEMDELLALSDRILVMHEGRLKGEMTASEANQEKLLTLAMSEAGIASPQKIEGAIQ